MNTTKKSLEWLKPLELNSDDAKKFSKAIKKPISKANLVKQKNIFKVAKHLNEI